MWRRRYGSRRRRGNFGSFARRVRRVTGIMLAKRIIISDFTIPDVTAADFDNPINLNLVIAAETNNEELESNGTTIAECPTYSRLVSFKMQALLWAPSSTTIRWMLHKRPDGEATVITSSMIDANFHSSDDNEDQRELRKNTLAKGIIRVPADRLQTPLRIFVSRKAWARASPMREDDEICLTLAKSAEGTSAAITGMGTIYVKANG